MVNGLFPGMSGMEVIWIASSYASKFEGNGQFTHTRDTHWPHLFPDKRAIAQTALNFLVETPVTVCSHFTTNPIDFFYVVGYCGIVEVK